MFESQILIAGESEGDSQIVFSHWLTRSGDYLLVTVEVVQLSAAVTLETKVFTKNSEDTGDGSDVNAGTSISQTTAGRSDEEWGPTVGSGLKELVRYRFKASANADGPQWVLFRVLPPVWFDAVRA